MKGQKGSWLVGVALMAVAMTARAVEIDWDEDLTRAVVTSRQLGRPLLILVTSQDCAYCIKLKRDTLSDATVVGQIGHQFVAAVLNAPDSPHLVERLGVRVYPTLVVITPDKYIADRIEGFVSPDRLRGRLLAVERRIQVAGRPVSASPSRR